MKLAEALALLPSDRVQRIAGSLQEGGYALSQPLDLRRLEAALLSAAHVELAITRRRPPVLSLLTHLLRANGRAPVSVLRERVLAHADQLCRRVTSGELLARPGCELYRRVLMEAWRSDLSIDPSEAAILGVLRHELGMRQVEHFLATHHRDVRSYWDDGDPFGTVVRALEDAGVLFRVEGELVLPEDLFPAVRVALGVALDDGDARRLYERLSGSQLAGALKRAGLRTSGSKAEKVERLVEHFVDPREVLSTMHIWSLQELCARTGDRKTGAKEELVARLVERHAQGLDQVDAAVVVAAPEVEEKALSRAAFAELFGALSGAELAAMLWRFKELRQSGSKERRVATLWESPFGEATLLGKLKNSDLANVLERVGAKRNGSKEERIERLVGHFRRGGGAVASSDSASGAQGASAAPSVAPVPVETAPLDASHFAHPWMDEGVPSLVAEPDWPEASARGSIEVELEHALPELAPSADEERALAPQDPGAPLPRKLEDPTENWLLSEDSIWD